MTPALIFEAVTKRYARNAPPALDKLSFTVPRGVVCGLVGPNGAGKTTAFSVISGFLPPDEGRVDLLGMGRSCGRQVDNGVEHDVQHGISSITARGRSRRGLPRCVR